MSGLAPVFLACMIQAADHYQVPVPLLRAIQTVEGGRIGMANRNTNGSFDYGLMQINSSWLDELRPYGYTAETLRNDGCANIAAGAWVLSWCFAQEQGYWEAVGCYHSPTQWRAREYAWKVFRALKRQNNG